jgi:hypothetical protein
MPVPAADELFELTEALLRSEGPVKSLVGLCQAGVPQRIGTRLREKAG